MAKLSALADPERDAWLRRRSWAVAAPAPEDGPAPHSPESPPCSPGDEPDRAAWDEQSDRVQAVTRNIRMMHLLERIARAFNDAGIPLMVLKGAALNLTVYHHAADRPMDDLDLLVKPEQLGQAIEILEQKLHCTRGRSLVREDFFPRFHYEMEFVAGSIYPTKIDLHVRPFRPLRYAQLVPPDALWGSAVPARIGGASVMIPSAEGMLIHLAAHAAIHDCGRPIWLQDLKGWADQCRMTMNWDKFLNDVQRWRLALPVRVAVERAQDEFGEICPPWVMDRLTGMGLNWRDRLALWHAPRDGEHPVGHVAVCALSTPGLRFVLGYLAAIALPGKVHMAEWYAPRHRGWLVCAHLLRLISPLTRLVPRRWAKFSKVEVRESHIHGLGVFATRDIQAGELVGRYHGKRVDYHGIYVVHHKDENGAPRSYEITGKLKHLNHNCRPRARLEDFKLIALRPLQAGEEITIDYGPEACTCRLKEVEAEPQGVSGAVTAAT